MRRGFAPILIILLFVVVALGAFLTYRSIKSPLTTCTLDVKICPDGSAVGRSGLQCEFATCPTSNIDDTANWKTYNSTRYGYSIKYPQDWIAPEIDPNGTNLLHILHMGTGSRHGFSYGGPSVLVEVASIESNNQEYVKANISPSSNPIKVGNVTINGVQGEKWSFNVNDNDTDNYAVFFIRNGKRYVLIKEHSNKSKSQEHNLEIDQVLRTFKFTE